MKIAMIGLGKMGGNMARRLIKAGIEVIGYDHFRQAVDELAKDVQIVKAYSLPEVIANLPQPHLVWLMLPAGDPTEETIKELKELLQAGDIVVDGGNSYFKDSIRRYQFFKEKNIHFLDAGVSGGIWGLTEGYALMIGGDDQPVEQMRPVFEALAPANDRGWGHVGPAGSGHYVKMVHNGIEYGMMEAYAEGFELLRARQDFHLDLHQIAELWRFGSVVRSWLLDLTAAALAQDPDLSDLRGWVEDSGEGRWTVEDAIDHAVPVPVIALSLFRRFESRQPDAYSAKLLAAMRNQFGGHAVKKEEPGGQHG